MSEIRYNGNMTTREFFTGRAIVISVLLVIGLGFFVYNEYISPRPTEPVVETPIAETPTEPVGSTEASSFTWKYDMAATMNPDGLPETHVSLEVLYGTDKISKLVYTAPGSCNDLTDREKDSVSNSKVAQCYAAGAGDRFKVTKGPSSYLVMKQEFFEGSPEFNPPVQPYKTVAEFPFTI